MTWKRTFEVVRQGLQVVLGADEQELGALVQVAGQFSTDWLSFHQRPEEVEAVAFCLPPRAALQVPAGSTPIPLRCTGRQTSTVQCLAQYLGYHAVDCWHSFLSLWLRSQLHSSNSHFKLEPNPAWRCDLP